jgi:hypothetical protein
VEELDPARIRDIWDAHGCLVVRGLMAPYADTLRKEMDRVFNESLALLSRKERCPEGWHTPNGALFIPAPERFERDVQMMCLPLDYKNSATLFGSAFEPHAVAVAQAVLGPNVELFGNGQCLYKEPVGGHPKHLHQDAAYFEHKYEGPVAALCYAVDTDIAKGALHVVPGSHKLGVVQHTDTISHLGLDGKEWPWDRAVPVEGKAGDAIFFHVNTIHGSKENHSDGPRGVFIHRYRRADDYVVIGATTTENRSEAEAEADQRDGSDDQGFMVSGFRTYCD